MTWRPYLALLEARFLSLLQYRAAAAAGFVTQLFWGLIRILILNAWFQAAPEAAPLSGSELAAYIWLGQAIWATLPMGPDPEVRQLIRRGDVAYELARPLDLYGHWFARAVAQRTAPAMLRAMPVLVVAALCFGLPAPPSAAAFGTFLLSLSLGVLLSAAITVGLNVSLLWTVSGEGITRLAPALVYCLSGMMLPLPLLPEPLHRICEWLPFRGMVDLPLRAYSGHLAGPTVLTSLGLMLVWWGGLVAVGRALLALGHRRLVVQGG